MQIDISYLKDFFDYKPILDEDPQWLVDDIKSIASEYLEKSEIDDIQSAYEFARSAHQWQVRQSWEHYISHVVQATKFLMLIKPDAETIKWCFLHDVIEDCDISFQDIEKVFGTTVAKLCEGVTKVSKLKYRGEERQVETIKKTFFAMSEDLRVIFIKFADRIHNIQTLGFHPTKEKRDRIVAETLEIYVPIAERLGLYGFHYLLENGCFRVSNQQDCDQIIAYLDRPIFQKAETKWIQIITDLLQSEWLFDFHVKWRLKSPYRIWKKMEEKYNTSDINSIYDLIAFRILVDSVANCYLVMGIIHNKFTPLVHKIKDYIVVPKPNWYQSIHSTILGMFNFPVEIQIRTFQMDKSAEYGVAAHFAYKESDYGKSVKVDDRQSQRVLWLQEIVKSYQEDNESFKSEMKIELLDDNIFLYTPKGEVIEMKKWSTVLDFAFRIHSQVWLRFKNALVNGSIVPIDYQPNTGDIVTINTWKNHIWVTSTWLEVAKTSLARNQVNKYLKSFYRQDLIDQSIKNLNNKLTEMWFPLYKSENCKIYKTYKDKLDKLDSLLVEMHDKWWYGSFINSFYKKPIRKDKKLPPITPKEELTGPIIYIDGQSNYQYIRCNDCQKIKSDNIIWKVDKKWLIKLHKIWCRALLHLNFDKLVPAYYQWHRSKYRFELHLKLDNKYGILNKILIIFTKYGVNIDTISFVESWVDFTLGDIIIEVDNPSKIWFVIKNLQNLGEVEILSKKFIKI